ncbi:MAG: TolC family protein [Treponema sp.]|jgi:outer membrane protein TolC|nr:TolC family protein [Treponema sp.]
MKKRMLCAAALCVLACAAFAEEPLSLEAARERALAHSRSLARYALTAQSEALDAKTQLQSMLPSFSLGASARITLWDIDGNTDLKSSFSAGLNAGVSQTVYDGGKYAIQKAINAISAESTRQEALAEYYAVLEAADSAYYAVLEAAASLESAEGALETASLALSIAEVRRQSKMLSDADYLQALAEKESKENARNQARRDLRLSTLKLAALTGFSEGEDLPAPDAASVEGEDTAALIDAAAALDDAALEKLFLLLWERALAKNPALARSRLSTQSAQKAAALARRDYVPSLSASLSLGSLGYTPSDGFSAASSGSFSLGGSIPLDFCVTAAAVKKRDIALAQAGLDAAGTEETLALTLRAAVLSLASEAGAFLSARRSCDYAQRHFDYVLELYRLSRNSQSELSDAAALLQTNKRQLIQTRFSFLRTFSSLRSIGVFEDEAELAAAIRG